MLNIRDSWNISLWWLGRTKQRIGPEHGHCCSRRWKTKEAEWEAEFFKVLSHGQRGLWNISRRESVSWGGMRRAEISICHSSDTAHESETRGGESIIHHKRSIAMQLGPVTWFKRPASGATLGWGWRVNNNRTVCRDAVTMRFVGETMPSVAPWTWRE